MKLFCDCANLEQIKEMSKNPMVKGFTTNPTLMYKAGIKNYESFAKSTVEYLSEHRPDTCISFEVFADDLNEIDDQAIRIDNWFIENKYPVYIKIPIMNTKGELTENIIKKLSDLGILINVTAVLTSWQIYRIYKSLNTNTPSIISIFAGRIADTGSNPKEIFKNCVDEFVCEGMHSIKNTEFLWASPRQIYDYLLAKQAGADIITMTPELINKLPLIGKDLEKYSLETVKMFYEDGQKAGFKI